VKVERVQMGVDMGGDVVWVSVSAYPVSGQNILITIAGAGDGADLTENKSQGETSAKVTSRQVNIDENKACEKDEIDGKS
jgi:hypothetical protein